MFSQQKCLSPCLEKTEKKTSEKIVAPKFSAKKRGRKNCWTTWLITWIHSFKCCLALSSSCQTQRISSKSSWHISQDSRTVLSERSLRSHKSTYCWINSSSFNCSGGLKRVGPNPLQDQKIRIWKYSDFFHNIHIYIYEKINKYMVTPPQRRLDLLGLGSSD